jgi:hypothetical protein
MSGASQVSHGVRSVSGCGLREQGDDEEGHVLPASARGVEPPAVRDVHEQRSRHDRNQGERGPTGVLACDQHDPASELQCDDWMDAPLKPGASSTPDGQVQRRIRSTTARRQQMSTKGAIGSRTHPIGSRVPSVYAWWRLCGSH